MNVLPGPCGRACGRPQLDTLEPELIAWMCALGLWWALLRHVLPPFAEMSRALELHPPLPLAAALDAASSVATGRGAFYAAAMGVASVLLHGSRRWPALFHALTWLLVLAPLGLSALLVGLDG